MELSSRHIIKRTDLGQVAYYVGQGGWPIQGQKVIQIAANWTGFFDIKPLQ